MSELATGATVSRAAQQLAGKYLTFALDHVRNGYDANIGHVRQAYSITIGRVD